MFAVDFQPLYPPSVSPTALLRLRSWYIAKYGDRLFLDSPAPAKWFTAYLWLEITLHVIPSVWVVATRALLRGKWERLLHMLYRLKIYTLRIFYFQFFICPSWSKCGLGVSEAEIYSAVMYIVLAVSLRVVLCHTGL